MKPLELADHDAWLARARSRMIALRAPGRSDAAEIVDGLVTRLLPAGLSSPDQHVLVGDGSEVWFMTGADPVFGDNLVARRLYDSLGYEVTEAFLGVDL